MQTYTFAPCFICQVTFPAWAEGDAQQVGGGARNRVVDDADVDAVDANAVDTGESANADDGEAEDAISAGKEMSDFIRAMSGSRLHTVSLDAARAACNIFFNQPPSFNARTISC